MKRTIRYAAFETNSSSEHTLVVFEDEALKEEWMGDPDLFLDLRKADWVGEDGDPEAFWATAADLIRQGDDAWEAAMAERVAWHNDNIASEYGLEPAERIEDFSDNPAELAVSEKLVPADFWSGGNWDGWGVMLADYEVDEWSADSVKEYAAQGYPVVKVTVGDNH